MKKQQLQKVLKPLIKECIKEVIFEEGVLSNLISEVVRGLGTETLVEQRTTPTADDAHQDFARKRVALQTEAKEAMEEKKRKLEEQLGGGFSGIFENTEPLSRAGSPAPSEGSSQGPLSNYAPHDSGVDISGLMNLGGGQNWKKMI